MAQKFRTKDGHTVRYGDTVWAANGTGPYVLTPPPGIAPSGWTHLVGGEDGEDLRLHAPEDITLYYLGSKPRSSW